MLYSKQEFEPWRPTLMFAYADTRDLYAPTNDYEDFLWMLGSDSNASEYVTSIYDNSLVSIQEQLQVVNRIKRMMKDSLVKGLTNDSADNNAKGKK